MNTIKFPFYAKASFICIGLYVFVSILYIAQQIIVPIVFSIILAIVLHPAVNFFVRKKMNRILAIVITLFIAFLLLTALGMFLFLKASIFSESWPKLIESFSNIADDTTSWISRYFNIHPHKIKEWVNTTKTGLINNSSSSIGQTLMGLGSGVVVVLLIPVYVFLMLYYKPLFLDFFHKLFITAAFGEINGVITQIKTVIQHYLTGLFIEMIIVAILNIAGLLILGIEYAVLLGIIGALLNLIPYIGGLVAVALPMMIALVTKPPIYALYVLGIYYFIQLVDNNYIVPKIVASKVQLNALVSIIAVIAFGALWGVSGMFLSIPLTAILKVVCDYVDVLKPWGFLMGDTMPTNTIFKIKLRGKKV